jgi:CobQ-like glutamine amidotransferase family enzyme
MSPPLRIVHLYPDLLSTYGDRGNVMCLAERARWRGIDVEVAAIRRGDALPPDPDLIFMGGGQDRCQQLAAPDLLDKAPAIAAAAEAGAVVFAVCGGYQLLGAAYRTADGDVPGLGLLDLWTEARTDRYIGNAAVSARIGQAHGMIVGFENHAGRTYLGPRAQPLGRVTSGRGNNGEDGTEGAVQGTVIGTYLHGPVLPRNAWLADTLLTLALERRGMTLPRELDDSFERGAHAHGLRLAARRRGKAKWAGTRSRLTPTIDAAR